MWYRFELRVPDPETQANPTIKEISLPAGIIKKVRVRYPPGPRNQVYIRVMLGVVQLFPRGPTLQPPYAAGDLPLFPQYWFRGDDEVIEWDEHVPTQIGDHWFIEGYAENCRYAHTVAVGFNIMEEDVANPWRSLEELVAMFKRTIGL